MSTYLLHRVARACALAALLYVAGLGLLAVHADAATYHTYLCRIPYGPNAGKPAPTDNTVYTPYGASTVALQNCAAGGAMTAALTKDAQPQGAKAIITFTAPGGLTVAGFRVWRHIGIHPGAVGAGEPISNLAYTGQQSAEPTCAASAGCTQRGELANPLSPANEVALPNLSGVTEVAWGVGCRGAGGTCPAAGGTYSAVYNVLALDVLLNDATPPAVSGVGGPLLGGGTLSGAQSVSFNAADGGSGVSTGTITVDGAVAVARVLDSGGGGCANLGVSADGRPSYLNTQPCAPSVSGLLTLDTNTLSPGAHAIVVTVTDAAGNATVVNTSTIDVAGSVAPGTPNGAGASRAAKLSARWTSTRRPSRRLGFSARPTLTGTLADEAGRPITGAAIEILVREKRAGARSAPIGTATTGSDGAFRIQLPSGPSRTVTIQYRAFSDDPKPAALVKLRTVVRAQLSASASPRSPRVGGRLTISGRLKYLRRGNVDVTIQARDGRVWRTIGTVKTRRDGRFRWNYRFRTPASAGRTFGFRARVNSVIYPFAAGSSKTVLVRVRR